MGRVTAKTDGEYCVVDGDAQKAIQRLGEFEDACEALFNSQAQIAADLENLRKQGKEKTVRYKETMAQKLINNSIATFFEKHGLK